MELILVPFGIVVTALLLVGAVTGAVFKFVWVMLRLVFVVCFWWLLLLVGGVALLRSIVHRPVHYSQVERPGTRVLRVPGTFLDM